MRVTHYGDGIVNVGLPERRDDIVEWVIIPSPSPTNNKLNKKRAFFYLIYCTSCFLAIRHESGDGKMYFSLRPTDGEKIAAGKKMGGKMPSETEKNEK